MSRSRIAWLLVVLLAVGGGLGYGLAGRTSTATPTLSPSLRPLIAKAGFEPCVDGLARRTTTKPVLPDLRLACLDGTGSQSLLYSGTGNQQPTLVNVYGAWCLPCASEMPLLRQLHALAGARIRLVGIDTEDDPSVALHFAIDLGQHWPALRDDDGLVSRALGGGAPKSVFVDSAGNVVHVERGAYANLRALRFDVQRYLGVSV